MNLLVEDSRVILDPESLTRIVEIGGRDVEKVLRPNVDLSGSLMDDNGVNIGVESISKAGKVGVSRGELIKETKQRMLKESSELLDKVKRTVSNTIEDSH